MKDFGTRCYLIAEVAQAHDGSLGTALAYIDAAAAAGADAVKFQCHIAADESTPSEPWRIKFSHQDESRYDYWKRMEFTFEQWKLIKSRCDEREVDFICSPFSLKAVEMLNKIGVPVWKVASGEFMSQTLISAMQKTGKPIWLSTGMVDFAQINQMVNKLKQEKSEFVLFQCTTAYPCPPEKIGLETMKLMAQEFGCPVGLSDHSGAIFAGLAAASHGAKFLEVHIVFSKDCFGPDVSSSITLTELKQLRNGLDFINQMVNSDITKDQLIDEVQPMIQLFSKSVVVKRRIKKGSVLAEDDLGEKKPGTGIPANRLKEIVGKTVTRDLKQDELLSEADFE